MRQDKVIPPPQHKTTSVSNQRSAVPQDPKTSSIQDSSPEQQGGENLQDAQLLQEGDTSESEESSSYNSSFEHYSRGTSTKDWQLDYNVSYDQSDTSSSSIFLDGKLLIRSCNKIVFLDNPISLSR